MECYNLAGNLYNYVDQAGLLLTGTHFYGKVYITISSLQNLKNKAYSSAISHMHTMCLDHTHPNLSLLPLPYLST